MNWSVALIFALTGLAVGSFLNVCIVRLPADRSLWRPGSACPACGAAIRWRDNVPVLSFLALRGRCRACASPISWQYPIVEILTSAAFVLTYFRFGLQPDAGIALAFSSALIVVTGIDLVHQIIPDVVTLPGIGAGVLANLVTGRVTVIDSLLGILVGGGTFFVIILASRGGMGGGDMKLGAMLGAFLGWKITLIALLVAVLTGGAVAVVLLLAKAKRRKDPVPFGPFLALGGMAGLFWGERLLAWYLAGLDR
jgi:leader peptidase (prepilin peptidase)/N-methyltransferase